jgi:hypothetical protein
VSGQSTSDEPRPIAPWVVAVLVMDPAGQFVSWRCYFALTIRQAERWLEGLRAGDGLEGGWTIRDAFIAADPLRILGERALSGG